MRGALGWKPSKVSKGSCARTGVKACDEDGWGNESGGEGVAGCNLHENGFGCTRQGESNAQNLVGAEAIASDWPTVAKR
jgi:hypothetical protein